MFVRTDRDIVERLHKRVLDHLDIASVVVVIGGLKGALQVQ